jgi:ABC-type sugar transport system substrate-binding protein
MLRLNSLVSIILASWLFTPAAMMAQKQLHIVVVTHGAASDSFWAPVRNGAIEGGKETGCLVEYRAPEKFDMVAMSHLIEATVEGLGQNAEVLATTLDFTEARNAISAYLAKVPDLEGIMVLGPDSAEAALQALESAGKLGKLKFGGFDLSPGVLQAVSKGQIDFAIDQQPFLQGYLPIVFLVNYLRYGIIPSQETVFTGPNFVTRDTAAKAMEFTKKGIR